MGYILRAVFSISTQKDLYFGSQATRRISADATGVWIGPFAGVSNGTAEVCEAGLLTRIVLGVFVVLGRAFVTAQHAFALVQLVVAKVLLDRPRDIFRVRVQVAPKRADAWDGVVFARGAALVRLFAFLVAPVSLSLALPRAFGARVEGVRAIVLALWAWLRRARRRRVQANDTLGTEFHATQVGIGEIGVGEVDDGLAVGTARGGSDLRATQVGAGEVGLSEVDDGLAEGTGRGSDLRATQVGASEVGATNVDGGVTDGGVGSDLRATQVGVREVGATEVDEGGAGEGVGSDL
eukprot:scaffold36596_cov52-Phaeocystis_antarctica.AAC.3